MKRHLNTLFVMTQGSYLCKEGECICVRVEKETRLRIPAHTLNGIICFGRVSCSPFLMGFCGQSGIVLSFLSEHGRFLARVQGPISGNVILRREQYRRADDKIASAHIIAHIIAAKMANARTVLQRALRDHPEGPNPQALEQAVQRLGTRMAAWRSDADGDTLRGWEGDAARTYFSTFDHLIVAQKDTFFFNGRNRRPPLDNINALLSFAYTLLTHDIAAALESVGLDPAVGFLHRDRPGRPSLALDLVEELRPILADRLILNLVNRKQIQSKDFSTSETHSVTMNENARKILITAWQKRKDDIIVHPYLQEKISFGLLPHIQAMLMARHLRGDIDAYPAFIWK